MFHRILQLLYSLLKGLAVITWLLFAIISCVILCGLLAYIAPLTLAFLSLWAICLPEPRELD